MNATTNQYVKASTSSFNCGTSVEASKTNDKNRTWMLLECIHNKYYSELGFEKSEFAYRWTIRPYKKTAGIWFYCSRNVDYNIRVVLEYFENNWYLERVDRSGHFEGSFDQKVEWIKTKPGWEDSYQLHFAGYKAWADTPSTDPAYTTCNIFFFLPEGPPIK